MKSDALEDVPHGGCLLSIASARNSDRMADDHISLECESEAE